MATDLPLTGIRVVERSSGVAAAYTGRLLAAMGAETVLVEPPEHCPLRNEPPFLGAGSRQSALFAYLAAGKRSVLADLSRESGRVDLDRLLATAQIFIDDTPLERRTGEGVDRQSLALRHPHLVHVSVLPFGAAGPKANWGGAEINLIHAGGEGYLLPNGLSVKLFPDRPPLKIAGRFAEMQGGVAAALGALSALWTGVGEFVDISVQDANVAVSAFAIQRYGDGSVEHRTSRSFRYGGVIECRDGYVELLMLEERQWRGMIELLGSPDWATDPTVADAAARSQRGDFINERIRAWARERQVDELVAKAQELGVPMARYNTPAQVLSGYHETARALFGRIDIEGAGPVPIQTAPFRFGSEPLPVGCPPPRAGADQALLLGEQDHEISKLRATA